MQYFDSQVVVTNSLLNVSEYFSNFIQTLELLRWINLISYDKDSSFYI